MCKEFSVIVSWHLLFLAATALRTSESITHLTQVMHVLGKEPDVLEWFLVAWYLVISWPNMPHSREQKTSQKSQVAIQLMAKWVQMSLFQESFRQKKADLHADITANPWEEIATIAMSNVLTSFWFGKQQEMVRLFYLWRIEKLGKEEFQQKRTEDQLQLAVAVWFAQVWREKVNFKMLRHPKETSFLKTTFQLFKVCVVCSVHIWISMRQWHAYESKSACYGSCMFWPVCNFFSIERSTMVPFFRPVTDVHHAKPTLCCQPCLYRLINKLYGYPLRREAKKWPNRRTMNAGWRYTMLVGGTSSEFSHLLWWQLRPCVRVCEASFGLIPSDIWWTKVTELMVPRSRKDMRYP